MSFEHGQLPEDFGMMVISLATLNSILHHECGLTPNNIVVTGVSGGADSLCLLDILLQCGFTPVVVHLNHGLRPEAEREAQMVARLASDLGVEFVLGRANVAETASTQGLTIEEAAREIRYRFLFAQAEHFKAQAVAVGHTADDQVETVLMHLLRGSGLDGLTGMSFRSLPNPWSASCPLVRPLLSVWREEVAAHIQAKGWQHVNDASNLDRRYFRNRLRHDLIPYLETYNPHVRRAIHRMSEVLAGERQIILAAVESGWESCVQEIGPGYVGFSTPALRSQPVGMQRRILRRGMAHLRSGMQDVDFQAVERGIAWLQSPATSSQVDLIAGVRMFSELDTIWLAAREAALPVGRWPQVAAGDSYALEVEGDLELPDNWRITARVYQAAEGLLATAKKNPDPYQAWLDVDKVTLPLTVRGRQPGDRMQLLGMRGRSVKLSDLMINVKLPSRARNRWPVVCSGDEVIWLPGVRVSEIGALSSTTSKILHIAVKKVKGTG